MIRYLTFLLVSLIALSTASAQKNIQSELASFSAQTGAVTTIDKATGGVSFMRFPATRTFKASGGTPSDKAVGFVNQNSNLFAMQANRDEYQVKEKVRDSYGLEHVILQKFVGGVPVYDGILKMHFNKNNEIVALNGNSIEVIKLNLVPTLSKEEAGNIAIALVKGQKLNEPNRASGPLKINNTTLYVFQKGLAQGYNGTKHLVYEVEVRNDADTREFLFIDAHNGGLVEQFTGTHSALHRKLYQPIYYPGSPQNNLVWDETDPFPGSLTPWQRSELNSAGQIYHLMLNAFGRDSYDGGGATMITTHNNPNIQCPNANWNGVSANYCDNIASDDVVAHEWGHAYTEYTSGLIYQWQAGALNEAYSDIWGETVDLINNYFDANEGTAPRNPNGTDNPALSVSTRWRVGEKASADTLTDATLRDMYNPNAKGDPGRVGDPLYWCMASDNGGVHINSGVINHSYALLVDGGNYNNIDINGIGLTKAAHIYWYAQANFMTKTTDFAAQADILEAAAEALIALDQPLPNLSTVPGGSGNSGLKITYDDLAELRKVIQAVELREEVNCGFTAILQPVSPLCEGASASNALFSENFESGLGGFTTSSTTTSATWVTRNWTQVPAPGGRTGHVAFGVDYEGGDCGTSNQQGIIRLESPIIYIPAGTAGKLNLVFDHYIATEEGYDGGNIKYSINGGTWGRLPANAFTANPYNQTLLTSSFGSNNPLGGEAAFTGTDGGSLKGSWGQSQVDLSAIGLSAGGNIRLRWELGTDCGYGVDGWYIDDVRIYTCSITPAVHFVTSKSSVNEGAATVTSGCLKYVEKTVTVQIDKAPTQPVELNFSVAGSTAKQGPTSDFTFTPASVILDAAHLKQDIVVRIYDDAYIEGNEKIQFTYSLNNNSGDGYAATEYQTHVLTIEDDDFVPGNYTEELYSANFNSGPEEWRIINGGNYLNSWATASYTNAGLDGVGNPFFFSYGSLVASNAARDEILISPAINTAGKKNMVLEFSQDWYPVGGGISDKGIVSIWDGTAWQILLTQGEGTHKGDILTNSPNKQQLAIPDAYANADMKVRFQHVADNSGWWAIDNVKITSSNSTDILTTVNSGTGDQQYLGPNETAAFYDPTTGNLMAKIKNLTAHDYGCTTVEVDRAGTDVTPWVKSYSITNKTFKVTPTNNNPAGQYEITLYYKSSELPTFNGTAVKSMGKSEGGIGAGNLASTSYAEVQVTTAFNTDYAYTATFNSGFSGFGLSDAPPVGSLPVKLVKFEGKNTGEGNALIWATTSEVNSDYFGVERAVDGKNFKEISRVSGAGNSAVTNEYGFTDRSYTSGSNYYRLKQVDRDGTYAYSRIIYIDAKNGLVSKIYPNPVQSLLTVEIPDEGMKQVTVKIVSASGVVITQKENVKVQQGVLHHDVSKLIPGVYQIIVIGKDGASYNFSMVKM